MTEQRRITWASFPLQWLQSSSKPTRRNTTEDASTNTTETSDLYDLVLEMRWESAIQHCQENPVDASYQDGDNSETPLYLACQNRPPLGLIRTLLQAYPAAAETTCRHGDWPLHVACRCDASIEVLEELVARNPRIVGQSSKWGTTAVRALWESRDTTSDLLIENYNTVFWEKMKILLEALARSRQESQDQSTDKLFLVHAVVSLGSSGCPFQVFEFALHCCPEEVSTKDGTGRLPLHIACGPARWSNLGARKYKPREQQVISELLQRHSKGARCLDPNEATGRYPLHTALACRHKWDGGVKELFQRAPEVLLISDPITGVYPFQLAAIPVRDTLVDLDTVFHLLRAQPSGLNEIRYQTGPEVVPRLKRKYEDNDVTAQNKCFCAGLAFVVGGLAAYFYSAK
jgi:hypothetical protein